MQGWQEGAEAISPIPQAKNDDSGVASATTPALTPLSDNTRETPASNAPITPSAVPNALTGSTR